MTKNIIIESTGSYLPKKILTNDDLAKVVETTDEWIVQRTGIKQRHIADTHETTTELGAEAAVKALFKAEISPNDIDLIICATSTPDLTFPNTASLIQRRLEIDHAIALDIGQAACNGFITALEVGSAMMRNNPDIKKALIIGTEVFSRLLDWSDRSTCVLFGDGAGAVILSKTEEENRGLIGSYLNNQASLVDILQTDGGTCRTQDPGKVVMNGKAVFKEAVTKLAQAAEEVLKRYNYPAEAVDWFVPHQANQRIIKATADHLGLPMDKVISTVHAHANTSAASIPLALDWANEKNTFKKGDLLLADALGAGISWGAMLLRW